MQSEGAHAEAGEIDDGVVRLTGGVAKRDGNIGASLG
jgi:hypothetical protein